jgi:gliding motility-associated-like protein
MRNFTTFVTIFLLLVCTVCYPQTKNGKASHSGPENKNKNYKEKWKTAPFDHDLFIENNGQFDGMFPAGEKVLFAAQLGKVMAYFTGHGIIYQLKEFPHEDGTEDDPDKNPDLKPNFHTCSATWEGSNPKVSLLPEDKLSYNYFYPKGSNGTISCIICKKIVYKNLYPGIDAEYFFPKGKQGIEYTLTIHPGANLEIVKLLYNGVKEISKNDDGDVTLESEIDKLTDHAPNASVEGDFNSSVTVSYHLEGNTESYRAEGNYDKSKTLVIDPWITDPLFASIYNRAYDLDYDFYGNVYVFGSYMPYQLEKFNSAGVPQWVFNASSFNSYGSYGDVAVDRKNGTSYITEGYDNSGAMAMKINTYGTLLATYPGSSALNEFWRASYNPCFDNIVIGAGGTNEPNQACMLDTTMTTITPVNVLGATTGFHDMVLLAPDPSGLTCYMATSYTTIGLFDNEILQLPLPSLAPTTYIVPDNFEFHEANADHYVGDGSLKANGYNGIAVSPDWLYIYNGDTLQQLDKSTGIMANRITINNSLIGIFQTFWGGLAVDPCDDIFLGCADSLKVYNSSLTLDTAIGMSDTIYDVVLGQNNLLYLCGDSFVCSVTAPVFAKLIATATGSPTTCSSCNGTASITINCGVSPYSFLWSNGSTNQTDTGLCAGIYTITVMDASCPPRIDTAIVNVPGEAGFTASVLDTNPNCELSAGNITVNPSGGISPYTYSWSNGETTQEDTGLGAGTYTITITDNTGCKYYDEVILVNPVTPTITVAPNNDSICSGTNLPLTASGVNTYTWTPTTGLSCYTCASPIASPTSTTTYTVSGVDTNGCPATATATIKVYTIPKPVITGKDSMCSGGTDTLVVTGGTTYVWSNGATTSSISFIVTSSETLTVEAKNGICTHDTIFSITDVSTSARITASKDSTCSGDTIKLTGTGGTTYLWSNHSTSNIIIVNPSIPITYTLYTAYAACTDSATINLGVIKQATATLSSTADSACPGTAVTLKANLTGGPGTYKWSNGATTSSINVNDSVTTTYTATIYGKCDTMHYTITNKIVPLPKPVINGTNWKCQGMKDTLVVSGGTTYLWSNGSTKATYYTGDINGDSTFTVIAYNSLMCADTNHITITSRANPDITIIAPKAACSGNPVEIVAKASGAGPFTYSWSTGQSSDSISVLSPPDSTTVTYSVSVSNGCIATKTIPITAQYPILGTISTQTVLLGNDTILWASGNSSSYTWLPGTSAVCLNPSCDSVLVTPTVTTIYTVTGVDKDSCRVMGYVTVDVEIPCFNVTIPNVFTPNYTGLSGLDNIFYVKTTNLNYWSILIFDRWGKEIYNSTNPNEYWGGETESGGKAPEGVYYYVIKYTCNNKTYNKDGFVQMIR